MTDTTTASGAPGNAGGASGTALLLGDGGGADTGSTVAAGTAGDTVPAGAGADVQPVVGGGDWLTGLPSDEARGFIQNKGWKSPAEMLASYQSLETLVGRDKLPLPKDENDAEGMARLYKAVGRPDSPDGYKLSVPEGVDPAFATEAAKWFHEAGVGAKGAATLAGKWNEYVAAQQQQAQQAFQTQSAQDASALQTEWGQQYASNVELARRGAKQFGLGPEDLPKLEQALGTKGMMTFLHKVGSGLAEDTFEGNSGGGGGAAFKLTPEAAKARIAALKQDSEWTKRYLGGGVNEKAEFERLQRLAHPDAR